MAEVRIKDIDEHEIDTVLAEDIDFEGQLSFKKPLMIKGKFKGEITSSSALYVGEKANVEAKIEANIVSSKGRIRGDMVGHSRVELFSTAHVDGDINTPDFVVESGCKFNGFCNMSGQKKEHGAHPQAPQQSPQGGQQHPQHQQHSSLAAAAAPAAAAVESPAAGWPAAMRPRVLVTVILLVVAAVLAGAQDKPDALELYRAGKYADAIKVCQQELAEAPRNIDSHVVLGWSYLRLHKYAEALDAGRKGPCHFAERPPGHPDHRGGGCLPRKDRGWAEVAAGVRRKPAQRRPHRAGVLADG